jgi:hypothetical protein
MNQPNTFFDAALLAKSDFMMDGVSLGDFDGGYDHISLHFYGRMVVMVDEKGQLPTRFSVTTRDENELTREEKEQIRMCVAGEDDQFSPYDIFMTGFRTPYETFDEVPSGEEREYRVLVSRSYSREKLYTVSATSEAEAKQEAMATFDDEESSLVMQYGDTSAEALTERSHNV